jgi:hypothetical protein
VLIVTFRCQLKFKFFLSSKDKVRWFRIRNVRPNYLIVSFNSPKSNSNSYALGMAVTDKDCSELDPALLFQNYVSSPVFFSTQNAESTVFIAIRAPGCIVSVEVRYSDRPPPPNSFCSEAIPVIMHVPASLR